MKNTEQLLKNINSITQTLPALRMTQVEYLVMIHNSGIGWVSMDEFRRLTNMIASNASRALSSLIKIPTPLIEIYEIYEDRRYKTIHLTNTGKALLQKLFNIEVEMSTEPQSNAIKYQRKLM